MVQPEIDSLRDEELVTRVAKGDKKAFCLLVRRHGSRFRALAYRFVGDMALAEDLVQEAFIKLWTHAARFDDNKAKFTTWFHRIVVNRCLDEKRKRKPETLPEEYDEPDMSAGADAKIESDATNARLKTALDGLSERQHTAVMLSYFNGLSNQEAADVMELHIKAYESLLVRSRANMRKMLMTEKADLLSAFG